MTLRRAVCETLVIFTVLLIPAFIMGWGDAWWRPVLLAGISSLAWVPYAYLQNNLSNRATKEGNNAQG